MSEQRKELMCDRYELPSRYWEGEPVEDDENQEDIPIEYDIIHDDELPFN